MSLPLAGKTVLVTRAARQAAGLVEPLEALGATVVVLPAIAIAPPDDPAPLDSALRNLDRYDWIVLTSANGVEAMRDRAIALGVTDAVRTKRLAAVGPATAKAMAEAFREPDLVPSEYFGEAVAAALGDVRGVRFLLARADIAREELPRLLRDRGAAVDDVAAYRIVRPPMDASALKWAPDLITLTSSSAVHGTRDALEAAGRGEWMRTARLACIGPLTAATVRELGYEVGLLAKESTIAGLVEAIVGDAASQPPLPSGGEGAGGEGSGKVSLRAEDGAPPAGKERPAESASTPSPTVFHAGARSHPSAPSPQGEPSPEKIYA